jgi:hypothetical protein
LVTVLDLGTLTLPAGHPRFADRTSLIQGFVIHHPDGWRATSGSVNAEHLA